MRRSAVSTSSLRLVSLLVSLAASIVSKSVQVS